MANRLSILRAQQDPVLTSFAVDFRAPNNLIGRRVAPVVPVLKESGTFYTFGKEGLTIYNTERALRSDPKRIDWTAGKDTYLCVEHALETMYDHEELDEARRQGAQQILKMDQRAVQLTQNPLELEFEKAVADVVFDSANYATGNKKTLSGTSFWMASGGGEGTTSDPIGDIRDGIDAARDDMGRRPNTLVLGYDAWRALRDHSQMKAVLANSERSIVTTELVAATFGLDNVFVGESVQWDDTNSVFADLWTDNAALLYVPGAGELAEGTTPHTVSFEMTGFPKVFTYQDAYRKYYATKRKYQVKNINTSYGYLIVNVKE